MSLMGWYTPINLNFNSFTYFPIHNSQLNKYAQRHTRLQKQRLQTSRI